MARKKETTREERSTDGAARRDIRKISKTATKKKRLPQQRDRWHLPLRSESKLREKAANQQSEHDCQQRRNRNQVPSLQSFLLRLKRKEEEGGDEGEVEESDKTGTDWSSVSESERASSTSGLLRLHSQSWPRHKKKWRRTGRHSCSVSTAEFTIRRRRMIEMHQENNQNNLPMKEQLVNHETMSVTNGRGLKTCFSLSCLRIGGVSGETPEKVRLRAQRPYNSLTKKSRRCKGGEKEERWRWSWGSSCGRGEDESKEEFWADLKSDYDFLMGNQLIESCNDASGELPPAFPFPVNGSFNRFLDSYNQFCAWFNSLHNRLSPRTCPVEPSASVSLQEEVRGKTVTWHDLVEEGESLVERSPELKEEVEGRLSYVASKWDWLQKVSTSSSPLYWGAVESPPALDQQALAGVDLQQQVANLRKWLKDMEAHLQPLDFRVQWTVQDLQAKLQDLKAVQSAIHAQGKVVRSVVVLSQKRREEEAAAAAAAATPTTTIAAEATPQAGACQCSRAARALERRWHQLFLRSLEWQLHLDSLLQRASKGLPLVGLGGGLESDEDGPLSKYPRLGSCNGSPSEFSRRRCPRDEGDELDSSDDESSMDVTSSLEEEQMMPGENKMENGSVSGEEEEDSVASVATASSWEAGSKSIPVPNCSAYYFRHLDTDSEFEGIKCTPLDHSTPLQKVPAVQVGPSSDESKSAKAKLDFEEGDIIQKLVEEAETLVKEGVPVSRRARVKEWLGRQQEKESAAAVAARRRGDNQLATAVQIAYSCDASAESTTTSDGEEDVSEGGSTCRQYGDTPADGETPIQEEIPALPPVVVRSRKRSTTAATNMKERPKSFSELSWQQRNGMAAPSTASSDSALHQILLPSQLPPSLSSSSSTLPPPPSTSSSQFEKCPVRRRMKSRRRVGASKESGYSNAKSSGSASEGGGKPMRGMVKSSSFSGWASQRLTHCGGVRCSSVPGHLGSLPTTTTVTTTTNTTDSEADTETYDSKAKEEESRCEQADWDNYLERYMSEPYSEEPFDPEATKRLLDFGEDYRSFLDSHSDGGASSSRSSTLQRNALRRRRLTMGSEDSDSETEEMRYLLSNSERQQAWLERRLTDLLESPPEALAAGTLVEMAATCQENMHCLQLVERGRSSHSVRVVSAREVHDEQERLRGLQAQWERLKMRLDHAAHLQRMKTDLFSLKQTLMTIGARINATSANHLSSVQNLRATLQDLQHTMDMLNEKKKEIEEANIRTVKAQVLLDGTSKKNGKGVGLTCSIRSEVQELYRLSEENTQRGAALQDDLRALRDRWERLEQQKEDLERVLRQDRAFLLMQLSSHQGGGSLGSSGVSCSSTDSGVSDSDLELGEREGRMNRLKDSARDLIQGQALPAGSALAKAITDSLGSAEDQLEALKLAYRQALLLQPKPAFLRHSAKRREEELEKQSLEKKTKRKTKKLKRRIVGHSQTILARSLARACPGPSPPPPPPPASGSCPSGKAWRIIRIALAFQAVVLGLLSLAYLVQPECCDFSTSSAWGPHLSYINGVPPF